MQWYLKSFNDFTLSELYSMLRLRAEVFIVEQEAAYQDVDNKDQKAKHLYAFENGEVIAYTRIFKAGDYFDKASVGRVVVKPSHRYLGLGHELMKRSLEYTDKNNYGSLHISAQTYLQKFYEGYGFKVVSEIYLEDGLPHYGMDRE